MHNHPFARLCALAIIGCALAALHACADDSGGSLATNSLPPDCVVDADCQSQLPDLGACTQAVCNEGSCAAVDREDGASCAEAACVDAGSGDLRFVAAASCLAGSCAVAKAIPCAADVCEVATCDVVAGCQVAAIADSGGCDDGNACTALDGCSAGSCGGKPIVCDDNNPCTTDSCEAKTGCGHEPNKAPCDDSNACTDFDLCNGGECKGTAKDAADCDDSNPCTKDACDPKAGCTTANTTGACDDGNVCTSNDACKDGACAPGTVICACEADIDCADQNPNNQCLGKLYCDKASGSCKVNLATVVNCSSAGDTVCATNVCDPATAKCASSPATEGKACDADGSVCTSGDACKSGVCAPGQTVGCDDGNPCTSDACDAVDGCTHQAVSPDGSNPIPCDDGDVCTEGEGCKGGGCGGGKTKVCSDDAPCTQQTCDKIAGCQTSPSDGPCDDGDACTNGDVCTKGACAAGPAKSCDDGKLCTIDSCDAKLGCVHTPALGCNDCQGKASCTGAALPAFALLDQNKTSVSHNQLVEPLAWKGKPILMISVDGYCPTCVVQASKLQALHNQLKQQGVDVAMFALNNKVYATQFAVSGACDFPVLNDTAAAGVYGLLAVPAKQYVYVWDAQGKLVSYFVPWEFSMSDDANVAKVGALLTALAL